MGYVYLICDPSQEAYKIGVTRNLTLLRIKKLLTGNATELHIVHVVEYKYPFRLETLLHHRFKFKLAMNEWYYLDADEVLHFKDICNELINIIESLLDNPFFNKNLK